MFWRHGRADQTHPRSFYYSLMATNEYKKCSVTTTWRRTRQQNIEGTEVPKIARRQQCERREKYRPIPNDCAEVNTLRTEIILRNWWFGAICRNSDLILPYAQLENRHILLYPMPGCERPQTIVANRSDWYRIIFNNSCWLLHDLSKMSISYPSFASQFMPDMTLNNSLSNELSIYVCLNWH